MHAYATSAYDNALACSTLVHVITHWCVHATAWQTVVGTRAQPWVGLNIWGLCKHAYVHLYTQRCMEDTEQLSGALVATPEMNASFLAQEKTHGKTLR